MDKDKIIKPHHRAGIMHTDATKSAMSEAKRGSNNPRFKGFYVIHGLKFASSRVAAKCIGLDHRTIIARCTNPLWSYCGFSFEPATK